MSFNDMFLNQMFAVISSERAVIIYQDFMKRIFLRFNRMFTDSNNTKNNKWK